MAWEVSPDRLIGAELRRFSVSEYHRLIKIGLLTDQDQVELLDGYVVLRLPVTSREANGLSRLSKRLARLLPAGWELRNQSSITLSTSEPEPDLAIVRGDENTFATRHPGGDEIGLLIEIANSTLQRDRTDKLRIYAEAGITCYWIVNLVDGQIEEYRQPGGAGTAPDFALKTTYRSGSFIHVVLDQTVLGSVNVDEIVS